MQHSLIIRIYRKGQHKKRGEREVIHGTVENTRTLKTEAFSNKDELWRLVNNNLEGDRV